MVIVDNAAAERFEAVVDGEMSALEYRLDGDVIVLRHTEVPVALEGRGIASALVKFVLDNARERGLKVVPKCSYVTAWLRRHPEYDDLVTT